MSAWLVVAALLPEGTMQTRWFAVLGTFVAINTVIYLTLALIKILPKAYLSDWIDRRDRRSETRSIWPEGHEPDEVPASAGAQSMRSSRATNAPA